MMSYDTLFFMVEDGIVLCIFNWLEVRNALDCIMVDEIR